MIRVENLVFDYGDGGTGTAGDGGTGTAGDGGTGTAGKDGEDDGDDVVDPVLDGLSLQIPDGEFLVLAGPNGSGKSTLVRQFNGLSTPDSGIVRVNGLDPEASSVAVRAAVGMVFQHPRDQLVASTIGADVAFGPENLGLERAEIDRRVTEALATVRLDGRREESVTDLSGGEQARVALAGVLAMEPDHLVLDEPFVGLDADARASVLEHVRELAASETSVIVVTHDLRDLLSSADRVVVLADGRVALDAPPETARDRLPELGVQVPTDG